jgi:penicillin-binding protein 1A
MRCAPRWPSRRTWCRSALLQAIGPVCIQDYATRFGFDADKHPPYLTMALGAGSVTPWQMVAGYSVFANGGYRIQPYIVSAIRDANGSILAESTGDRRRRIIARHRPAQCLPDGQHDARRHHLRHGGPRLGDLKRSDLAGKTGTTNEHVDAWFCGYQRTVVGCAWIGFDQPRNLGNGETGGAGAADLDRLHGERAEGRPSPEPRHGDSR